MLRNPKTILPDALSTHAIRCSAGFSSIEAVELVEEFVEIDGKCYCLGDSFFLPLYHCGHARYIVVWIYFVHVVNMKNLRVLVPQNVMHVSIAWAGTTHTLRGMIRMYEPSYIKLISSHFYMYPTCKTYIYQFERILFMHAFVHDVIYIYPVELKTGPRFGVSSVKNWSKSSVKNWSNFFLLFFPSFMVFLGIFRNTNSATVCQNSVFAKFGGCQKWGFRKENCIFCFFLFYVGDLETEKRKKRKMEKAKKPL